jgi:carbonic anhydrase/acetyltransferase-like protein (isoleucine patch superfamily)
VLHTDMGFPLVIGKGCTIGHAAILHGCTIGDNSLVGMGATVLNGAKIGKKLPDRRRGAGYRRQGNPGQFTGGRFAQQRSSRQLGDDAVTMLEWSAKHYVENAKRFAGVSSGSIKKR